MLSGFRDLSECVCFLFPLDKGYEGSRNLARFHAFFKERIILVVSSWTIPSWEFTFDVIVIADLGLLSFVCSKV